MKMYLKYGETRQAKVPPERGVSFPLLFVVKFK